MKLHMRTLLTGSLLTAAALGFGGLAVADVVTRTSNDMLSDAGRGTISRDGGSVTHVRAAQISVADVGRGYVGLGQNPGTIIGTASSSGSFVNGGSATLDQSFGRR